MWVDNIVLPPMEIVLDVNEAIDGEALLYPNPSKGDFTLVLGRTSQVGVYTLTGQNVLHLNAVNGMQRLHLDAVGVYFVRISNEAGVEVKKVVVE